MRSRIIIATLCLGLGACALKPEPFTQAENAERAAADRATIDDYSPAPTGPVTLEEAQARAIAYNLDTRLQMFNAALQDRQLDLTKLDMLPNLTANAGYVARDKQLVSSSASYVSGQILPSNFETTSVERERAFGDLTLSWNIIDFGVSYLQAKQQSDRVVIADEQRRRVVNNVFQQVRSAYWTAVAAERIRPQLRTVLAEAKRAMQSSQLLESERSQKPDEALRYQRDLLELIQELESVDDQLVIAKVQLAQLMGLRPGTPYRLAVPASAPILPRIRLSIDEMERVALVNRPEVREEGYNARIVQNEGRRALLRLVPGVTMLASLNYDSNSYLLYNNWQEGGVRIAASLIRLLSYPNVKKLNEVQGEIADSRRLAMTMAVMAQIQVSAQQYQIARKNFDRVSMAATINRRIAELSADNQEAQTSSDLEVIREKATAALADLRRHRAYADLQNADAAVYVTLGLDPLPEGLETGDLNVLASEIRKRSNEWRSGKVVVPVFPAVPPEPTVPANNAVIAAAAAQ